jgi:hypothetical protein
VNAINEAIRAAKEAFEQPDLLAEVLAKGRTLPGAKGLPLGTGLAKRHSLEGAKPLEIGPQGAPGELAKRATVKGARRIEIARPWGGS